MPGCQSLRLTACRRLNSNGMLFVRDVVDDHRRDDVAIGTGGGLGMYPS